MKVFRFLWQHLGLEPGTDLRTLFRQAIGVPQGTFTAIFLEGATDRKIAFDRLLNLFVLLSHDAYLTILTG